MLRLDICIVENNGMALLCSSSPRIRLLAALTWYGTFPGTLHYRVYLDSPSIVHVIKLVLDWYVIIREVEKSDVIVYAWLISCHLTPLRSIFIL